MIRFFFGTLVVLLLAAAAAWLAQSPGDLTIVWHGWRLETSAALAGILVVALAMVTAALYRFWLWLRRRPRAFAEARLERRRQLGYQALSQGLVAVASGDAATARKLADRAGKLLEAAKEPPPLTLLLAAQAAQLAGDEAAAETQFSAMLASPETEFLGLRGLLTQAMRRNDRAKALELARRAHDLRPEAPWVLRELFRLEAAEGLWPAAASTLEEAQRRHALPAGDIRRHQGIVAFQKALSAEASGDLDTALKEARRALAAAPDLVPAAAMAAKILLENGRRSRAGRILREAWAAEPHPDLAAAYAALHPDAEPAERLKRVKELIEGNPEHEESRLALAAAEHGAGNDAAAREALAPLLNQPPSRRLAKLMAEIEQSQYGDGAGARDWLAKADAAAEAAWICAACTRPSPAWQAHCPHCGAFDTLRWRVATAQAGRAFADATEIEPPRVAVAPPAAPFDAGG